MSVNLEPKLIINSHKIQKNTQTLVSLCEKYKIMINGVTKATLGDPIIAQSMKKGGASIIADSRIQNIQKMIDAGIEGPYMLLRSPMLSQVHDVVRLVDISLNSELEVIQALGKQAEIQNKIHKIIVMVEMGDLREGEMPDQLFNLLSSITKIHSIELLGLGMNLTCYGAIIPTPEKIQSFNKICESMEKKLGLSFSMISGGNSSTIPLLLSDHFENSSITDLRLGESILLGRETVARTIIPGLHPDAFILEGEIIELKIKPSVPEGVVGEDAFGNKPVFVDKGMILHALIALGHQDIGNCSDLIPVDPNIEILGASSDHLIVNIKSKNYKIGDTISFQLKYGALLAAYTSPFVHKCYV